MESTGYLIEPVPYQGTNSDKQVNWSSHRFVQYGYDEVLCDRCDASAHGRSAFYPCGGEVLYQVSFVHEDGREIIRQLPANWTWDDIDQLWKDTK